MSPESTTARHSVDECPPVQPIPDLPPPGSPWWDLWLKLLVPVLLAGLIILAVHVGSLDFYLQLLQGSTYTAFLPALAAIYTLMMLLFQGLRTVLWVLYKPCPLPTLGAWPPLTVIIPAYNEGAMVGQAIASVLAADYPRDRLEIICVDDGSTDDTWSYIAAAQAEYPHLIKPLRLPRNRGKKEALYTGFKKGRGEVFVTIDSDSVIAADALRHLVAPLVQYPEMGAVAGNVKVYNRHQSLMGRMQGVRFVNLDYLRASQSVYGAVICTPGSLSAYRRSALMPHLEAWRRQTFLGAPCRHSEDRALTNCILRSGYYTCYQRTALVYTLVPENYAGTCKMYLRWERGNIRESLVQMGYLFTRYRAKRRFLPVVEFFCSQAEYPFSFFFTGLLLASIWVYPPILLKVLAAMGLVSLLNQVYYLYLERDQEFIYGIVYNFYAFFLFQWIYPIAVLTVRSRNWLTR